MSRVYDAMSWYEAIHKRHSVRAYKKDHVNAEDIQRISALCEGFSPLCKGARAYVIRDDAAGLFFGLVGPLGKITWAPSAVVFMADAAEEHRMEALGYLGEGIVLEATARGLGTCWVAGSFHRAAVAKRLRESGVLRTGAGATPVGEWKTVAITPLGYASDAPPPGSRLAGLLSHSQTRKALADIVTGLPPEEWPPGLDKALEAARWAPSAANRQPWRFKVDEHGITLTAGTSLLWPESLKRLDCGIAMLHFEVAAEALGLEGQWALMDGPAIARFSY